MSKKNDKRPELAKKTRPQAVDYTRFVQVWQSAKTVGDAARALNIKPNSATTIAKRLRDQGVALKRFPRRATQAVDVKKLNRIAKR